MEKNYKNTCRHNFYSVAIYFVKYRSCGIKVNVLKILNQFISNNTLFYPLNIF